MSFSKAIVKRASAIGVFSLTILLSACSWVDPIEGVEKVNVVTLPEVLKCEKLGAVNTSVLAKLGFIDRDKEAVMQDSIALAKNEAIRMGGNRLVVVQVPQDGHMRFDIYHCPNK